MRGGFRNPLATNIAPGAVGENELADGAVSSVKIASNLQSDNWNGTTVAARDATQGWRLEKDTGDLGVDDGYFRGDISGNWDGEVPPKNNAGNIGLPDEIATQGYYLHSDSGAVQFAGKIIAGIEDQNIEIDPQTWTGTTAIISLSVDAAKLQLLASTAGGALAGVIQALNTLEITAVDRIEIKGFQGGQLPRADIDADDINLTGENIQNTGSVEFALDTTDAQSASGATLDVDGTFIYLSNSGGAKNIDTITVNGQSGGALNGKILIISGGSGTDPILRTGVGGNMALGGGNFTLGFGDMIFLANQSGTWWEISRSNN